MEIQQALIFVSCLAVSQGNFALYKPTAQSSTDSHYRSYRAVDGKNSTNLSSGSCAQTRYQRRPWWRVDLVQSVSVWLVQITNRGDCCWTRLRDVQIRVGDSMSGPDKNSLCAYSLGSFGKGETRDFPCLAPRKGRYVYVTLMVTDVLTLCKVAVYASGSAAVSPQSLTGNIAIGKPVSQSSNLYSCRNNICRGNASKAIDGNVDANFHSGSCTHTKYQQNPWWRVDLLEREVVRKISLTNRGDCCSERLKKVEVRVGDNGCSYSRNPVCQSFSDEVGAGMTVDLHCKRRGRFLFVRLKYKAYLTLCEVQVYVEKGASLPWTKGNVSCRPKKGGGSYGWIAGPIMAFFFCVCCCGRGRRNGKAPQPNQHANCPAQNANSNQQQNGNSNNTEEANCSVSPAPAEAPVPQQIIVMESNGECTAPVIKDPIPIPTSSIAFIPPPEAPPPSYQEATRPPYINEAFELEYAPPVYSSYVDGIGSAPPPVLPR